MRRRIFQLAEDTPDWASSGLKGNVAHDHASKAITAKQLPQPLTVTVPFFDEDEDESQAAKKEYVLTFNFVQPIDTQSLIRLVQGNHCMSPIAHYSSATSMATPNSASTTLCPSSPL